jgi:hypothetical protein
MYSYSPRSEGTALGSPATRRYDLVVQIVVTTFHRSCVIQGVLKHVGRGLRDRQTQGSAFITIHDRVQRTDQIRIVNVVRAVASAQTGRYISLR